MNNHDIAANRTIVRIFKTYNSYNSCRDVFADQQASEYLASLPAGYTLVDIQPISVERGGVVVVVKKPLTT